jgi:hypothetical protein
MLLSHKRQKRWHFMDCFLITRYTWSAGRTLHYCNTRKSWIWWWWWRWWQYWLYDTVCHTYNEYGNLTYGGEKSHCFKGTKVIANVHDFLNLSWIYSLQLPVKQSNYRPWQAVRVPRGWGSQILRQLAHKCGKVVSRTPRSPLPPENIPGRLLISVRGWVDPRVKVGPEGICQWKNPVTTSGNEPATFRFVAQCLNNYATACPKFMLYGAEIVVCSHINTKHVNTLWGERTVVEC